MGPTLLVLIKKSKIFDRLEKQYLSNDIFTRFHLTACTHFPLSPADSQNNLLSWGIFSGKFLPETLILLFFSFILYMPTRLFLSGANKKSFKSKNSVGRKCCQLKVLKVLLMHLFVTLLINKTTGSDNRHFFFNTLEKENKEELLTYSTFCTLVQIEKKKYYGSVYCRMHHPKFI